MENTSRLYNALVTLLGQSKQWADIRHLHTLVWMVVGLIHSGSVNLTKWTMYILARAVFAQSKQRRFSRWLHNPRINPQQLYSPLIQEALNRWENERLYLSLDTSMLWNQYCLIRVAVVYRGRAVPVAWRVLEHSSSSVKIGSYFDLLLAVSRLMPDRVQVVLLADRGFINTQLMKYALAELGWHYRIRIKSDFWLWRPGKGWSQVRDFHLKRGEALLLQNVWIHKTESFGAVNLGLACEGISGELWYIVSDEPTTLQTFREYGLRFDIEESFLDDKSNGFELESCEIRNASALSRLCFVLGIATLYLTAQGTKVVALGKRRFVDPHWFRGNSYLKIGWAWVLTALTQGWELFETLILSGKPDPSPAMASRKQDEQKRYRLEFTVRSFDYAC
ncbi:MAG: transposase [Moorea sp. SIO3C2]|nr:transposase [Moorena sp. SIO3C2]